MVYGLGRPELMEELAGTMLDENATAAKGGDGPLTELEVSAECRVRPSSRRVVVTLLFL